MLINTGISVLLTNDGISAELVQERTYHQCIIIVIIIIIYYYHNYVYIIITIIILKS